jgi:hypothetical protein
MKVECFSHDFTKVTGVMLEAVLETADELLKENVISVLLPLF